MERFKFLPGDLVLVNLPISKLPSRCSERIQRGGFWPAKIIRKLQNCKRQVICYGTREEVKVPLQSMIAYNQQSIKVHLSHNRLVKDAVLTQALDEIESDFVAKTRTAEQLHLSGEAKLITTVVKSAHLLEINQQDNTLRTLWNSYVEKIGKMSGICHLPRILIDFATQHEEVMSQGAIFQDFMLHIFSLKEMGLISRIEVKNIVVDLAALRFEWNNSEKKTDNCPSVALEPSNASNICLDDPASSETIDSPYTNVDAKCLVDSTTKVLKDASPDEVVEAPLDGNLTSDHSDEVCTTLDSSTNCVIENAVPVVVSRCPSNSDTSLEGSAPSVAIDCPDDVVIDTPPERAAIVSQEDNPPVVFDLPSDASTSLHVGSNVINKAIAKGRIDIPNPSINEVLKEDSSSAVTGVSMTVNASPTVAENYPPSLCTHLLENATSIDVLDNLVDTSINLLTDPNQTTSLDKDQTQNVIDNPSQTGLIGPVEPATIASPSGDGVKQCRYGPMFDMCLMKEIYEEVSRGDDETVVEMEEEKYSNSNCTIEDMRTNENVEEMCLDMVRDTRENVAIIGLEKEVVPTQEAQRNLDICDNEDDENKDDDEVEIIQVVGSATFMKHLLFCNSKSKEINKSKRKRPMEKVSVNKKHLVHHKNTGIVDGVLTNIRSLRQSNPQQPWQGQSNPRQLWQGQSNPRKPTEGQSNPRKPMEGQSNPQQPMEGQSNPKHPWEGQSNFQQPMQGQSNPQQPMQGQSNFQQPMQGQSNPQQPWQGQSNPQQPMQGQSNPQQPWKGRCKCCGSAIDQSGSLNRDANGNNCAVKIIINAQLSTENFSRVIKETPNLRDMAGNVDENII